MNIIYILWLRQLKRYFRSKSRLIGSLAQPLLFMFAFGFGFGKIYSQAGEGDYMQFLVPGVITMTILFTAMFSGLEIIWDRQFGFLKEMLVAPVPRVQIMIGRSLGGATLAVFQGIVVLLLSFIVGFRLHNFWGIISAIGFMFLIAFLFTLLGTAIASRLKDAQGFQLIMNFLVMPMLFLSGAFFPLEGLPKVIYTIIRVNPLAYGVDAIRGALIGLNHFTQFTNFSVLTIITLLLLFVSSYLFSKIQV